MPNLCLLLLQLVLAPPAFDDSPATASKPPLPVSPGEDDRIALVERRCPTFSWGVTERASFYEIVVYRLPDLLETESSDTGLRKRPQPILGRSLPGSVSSFTPSLRDCFSPGARLVWFVRALRDTGDSTEWSEPRPFEIATPPQIEIERLGAELGPPAESTATRLGSGRPSARPVGEGSTRRTEADLPERVARGLDVGVAQAALKAIATDAGKHGVLGSASSTTAAGLVGANAEPNGPDLILEGDIDALFSEAGIDLASASPTTFEIKNSQGDFTLLVDGLPAVTTATDQDTTYSASSPISIAGTTIRLSTAGCSSGESWVWGGSSWSCSGPPELSCSTTSDTFTGGSTTIACPAGTTLTGGGFKLNDGPNGALNWDSAESRPSGNGWFCSVSVYSGGSRTCYARCCTVD